MPQVGMIGATAGCACQADANITSSGVHTKLTRILCWGYKSRSSSDDKSKKKENTGHGDISIDRRDKSKIEKW